MKAVKLCQVRLSSEPTEKSHDLRAIVADAEFLQTAEETNSSRKFPRGRVFGLECGPFNVDVSGPRPAHNLPPRWSLIDILLAIDSPKAR
jgi:hypothetical protein